MPLHLQSAPLLVYRNLQDFGLKRRCQTFGSPTAISIPTVTFDIRQVTASIKADVLSTLKSYSDIPKTKLPAIGRAAVASVERGRDLGMLHSTIMASGIAGMTKRRASEIAVHVHSRATSLMTPRGRRTAVSKRRYGCTLAHPAIRTPDRRLLNRSPWTPPIKAQAASNIAYGRE